MRIYKKRIAKLSNKEEFTINLITALFKAKNPDTGVNFYLIETGDLLNFHFCASFF
jgi:hypothetical protein